MVAAWLNLPVWALLGSLALFYAATAGLFHWLAFRGPTRRWVGSFRGVVAPFFGATALLFALLGGFLAGDVWRRNASAAEIVANERDTLVSLHEVATAAGLDDAALRTAIRDYARSTVTEEWPRMSLGDASPATDAASHRLMEEVLGPRAAAGGALVQRTLIDLALKVRAARAARLTIGMARSDEIKWAVVILLGVLTQLALALVHLDGPRPQLAALTVFSAAAVVALGLIAVQEGPFDPPIQVPSTPLQEVLQRVPAP